MSGARFDHTYYKDQPMPPVKRLMGDSCAYYTVDKGISGGALGTPPAYVGMWHVFSESADAFQAGFGPHAEEILADYTDLKPVMQMSDLVAGLPG